MSLRAPMSLRAAAAALVVPLAGCSLLGSSGSVTTVTVTSGPSSRATTSAASSPTSAVTPPRTPTGAVATTTQPPTLKAAFARARSGVVRIETTTCEQSGQGSGFIIGPGLVATVAHVVEDGQVVRVINGTTSSAGDVIGIDVNADVALVRTSVVLPGAPLSFASQDPEVGDEVAALGFTKGEPLSFKPGAVNSTGRKAVVSGVTRHSLLELDFASNHGNSGGPVIDATANVVGLVDAQTDYATDQGSATGEQQGDRLAVSAVTAQALISRWKATPEPMQTESCSGVVGPDGTPLPASDYPQDVSEQAFQTLGIYFRALNAGDFATALAQMAKPGSLQQFSKGAKSAQDDGFDVGDVWMDDDGHPVVWLRFTSTQESGDGPRERPDETCTQWSLDYHFLHHNGLWLIDHASAHEGQAANAPCGDL